MASPQDPTSAPATQQTSLPPPPSVPAEQSSKPEPPSQYRDPVLHNVALGVTPLALMALFLPPRRLDVRQVLLGGFAVWGTNQLVYDWSGRSFGQRVKQRAATFTDALTMSGASGDLPEKAQRAQALLRREREKLRLQQQQQQQSQLQGHDGKEHEERSRGKGADADAEQENAKGDGKEERGVLEAIWMGDQDDDWRAKRDQREREALSEGGGGYWGLIADQIAEVWGGGVKKEQEAQAAEARAKADADANANEGKKP